MINTFKIIWIQSQWIAKPQSVLDTAHKLTEGIPENNTSDSLLHIDETIKNKVLPNVIAVGLLNEFYNQLILKEAKEQLTKVNTYISNAIAKNDWFFRSVADQTEVKKKHITFQEFIKKYELRSDKDYELSCPRWYEIPDIIEK